ncbi:MAG: hypothetical protein EPO68_10525 [Planctomycetota bacterium]|nr:MAG: hypothetical protein EPO68_10525 [Planctomycetota bacterium]
MSQSNRSSDANTGRLLDRARAGDPDAERELFDEFRPALLADASRHRLMPLLARTLSAEDVVSELWLRCYSTAALRDFEHRGAGSLLRFLRIVLDRVVIDLVRRSSAAKRSELEPGTSVEATGARSAELEQWRDSKAPTPTSQARARELAELCRAVLEPDEWDTWRRAELDGEDSEAIGRATGRSAAAVRGTLFRARKKLLLSLDRRLRGGESR